MKLFITVQQMRQVSDYGVSVCAPLQGNSAAVWKKLAFVRKIASSVIKFQWRGKDWRCTRTLLLQFPEIPRMLSKKINNKALTLHVG